MRHSCRSLTATISLAALIGSLVTVGSGTAQAAQDRQCGDLLLNEAELSSLNGRRVENLMLDGQLLDQVRPASALVLKSRNKICLANLSISAGGHDERDAIRLVQNRRTGRIKLSNLDVAGSTVLLNVRYTKAPVSLRDMHLSDARSCLQMARDTWLTLDQSTLVDCLVQKVGSPGRRPLKVRFKRSVLVFPSHAAVNSVVALSWRKAGEAVPRLVFWRNTIYVQNNHAAAKLDRLFNKSSVFCAENTIVVLGDVARRSNKCRTIRSATAEERERVHNLTKRAGTQQAGQEVGGGTWIMPRPGPRRACPV